MSFEFSNGTVRVTGSTIPGAVNVTHHADSRGEKSPEVSAHYFPEGKTEAFVSVQIVSFKRSFEAGHDAPYPLAAETSIHLDPEDARKLHIALGEALKIPTGNAGLVAAAAEALALDDE